MIAEHSLLNFIKENGLVNFKKIVRRFNIPISKNKVISSFLNKLLHQNKIFLLKDNQYFVPKKFWIKEANININPKGFAFINLDDLSIFISPSNKKNAFYSDFVKFIYFKDPLKPNSFQGVVLEVIERKYDILFGKAIKKDNEFIFIPFKNELKKINFYIKRQVKILKENDLIKVKIFKYNSNHCYVEIKKNMGNESQAFIEINIAIEEAKVLTKFSQETINHSKKIPSKIETNEILNSRKDLRNEHIITIDGQDTKDFDDAIQIKINEKGNFILYVHIADVAHYVKSDDPIDKDAKLRGTSIYLVDRVLPMLPQKLSNGICSLNPNEDRFTMTVEIEIDKNGKNIASHFYESIINSKQRLTYEEVNNFFNSKKSLLNEKTEKMLLDALKLSKIIRKNKTDDGYIDFDIKESKISTDPKTGKTTKISIKEQGISEKLIEDFMVRANETVATILEKEAPSSIFRIHDKPSVEKLDTLRGILKAINIKNIIIPSSTQPNIFANLINKIKKERFDSFIKITMLRTMAKAKYDVKNIGHFGLASKSYTHFTSPIRRYPDLIIHRLLKKYVLKNSQIKIDNLDEIAKKSSSSEIQAVNLERKVDEIKKAEFYEQFIFSKKVLSGKIFTILNYGFFVEFENKVSGLVHYKTFNYDEYKVNDDKLTLTLKNKQYKIGDSVDVFVTSIDKFNGKISLCLK